MLFMVIERFRDNDMVPIYQKVQDSGRSLPDDLEYLDSWVEPNFSRCFQLMRCNDVRLFQQWVLSWRGFGVNIEIVPGRRQQGNERSGRTVSARSGLTRRPPSAGARRRWCVNFSGGGEFAALA
jgi:hypothetical protein